ncbi:hypothetical protein [Methanogenium cariaci]|uniref:hypothetical protein n=1 Tax=Methanogenium cariaci TaxID=2197 RepID=UPI00155DA665|nr:hypothetical protein [Methanogenium cariaci]
MLVTFLLAFSGGGATAQNSGEYAYLTSWETEGSGDGEFDTPFGGVAVDTSGTVYVADTNNHRIQKFTSNGTFVTKWQSIGSGIGGEFQSLPYDVAVDASGTVYVVDWNFHRITTFTSDGMFLGQWGSKGSGNGQFDAPSAVAVDGSGTVYVADTGNHRIQTFTSDGTYLTGWGGGVVRRRKAGFSIRGCRRWFRQCLRR